MQEIVDDIRDIFIAQVVGGKTFAEVGGLWGTVSEKVSIAQSCGAKALAMIDVTPIDNDTNGLWQKFKERMDSLEIYEYQSIDQDICNFLNDSACQQFDVVHCSGILYHHPHPFLILSALRKISRHHLVLTSAVTKEVIQNQEGAYHLPPSAVMLVPALGKDEFAVQRSYWRQVTPAGAEGLTDRCPYTLDNYAPWWWLPTPSALISMCEIVGFRVVDIGSYWGGNALTLLLETVPEEVSGSESVSRSSFVEDKLQNLRQELNGNTLTSPQPESAAQELDKISQLEMEIQQSRKAVQELEQRLRGETNAFEGLEQAHATIRAMESSKFWKIRTHWIKLKSKLSLTN